MVLPSRAATECEVGPVSNRCALKPGLDLQSRKKVIDNGALITALDTSAPCEDETLVAAIAYLVAAGSATEVLLDEIRAKHSNAPPKSSGLASALDWLVANAKYQSALQTPLCPQPPQPFEKSELRCPRRRAEAAAEGRAVTSWSCCLPQPYAFQVQGGRAAVLKRDRAPLKTLFALRDGSLGRRAGRLANSRPRQRFSPLGDRASD